MMVFPLLNKADIIVRIVDIKVCKAIKKLAMFFGVFFLGFTRQNLILFVCKRYLVQIKIINWSDFSYIKAMAEHHYATEFR